MREFELYGTVRAIICICDSMNYILEEEEVLGILTSAAHNYLDYGGLFIFDLNTEYKYREILGEQTIAEKIAEHVMLIDLVTQRCGARERNRQG